MEDDDTDSQRACGEGLPAMQLRMRMPASGVGELPDPIVPDGYELRAYREGDEESWVSLLHLAGFASFDLQRVTEYMSDAERRKGSRVVSLGDTLVSATFASRRSLERSVGMLDFVSTHPEHRRKGLSRAVCTGVLRFFVEAGYPEVILDTDDWRLPAIRMYLSMGFEPVMRREDMPGRWRSVMDELDAQVEGHA